MKRLLFLILFPFLLGLTNPGRILEITTDFKFPLGYPDMKGYHDAKPFGYKEHLGADLNKDGGGNNDLGDTIYAIGHGFVSISGEARICLIHKTIIKEFPYITSVYFHCDKVFVEYGDYVRQGQPIGTVGKKFTTYSHLHFEIITDTTSYIGGGFYGYNTGACVDPVKFINKY